MPPNTNNSLAKVRLSNTSRVALSAIQYELFDKDNVSLGTFQFNSTSLPAGGTPLERTAHPTQGKKEAKRVTMTVHVENDPTTPMTNRTKSIYGPECVVTGDVLIRTEFVFQKTVGERWAALGQTEQPKSPGGGGTTPPAGLQAFHLKDDDVGGQTVTFFRYVAQSDANGGGTVVHDMAMIDPAVPTNPPCLFPGVIVHDAVTSHPITRSMFVYLRATPDGLPRGPRLLQDRGRAIWQVSASYTGINPETAMHIVNFQVMTTDDTGGDKQQVLVSIEF